MVLMLQLYQNGFQEILKKKNDLLMVMEKLVETFVILITQCR